MKRLVLALSLVVALASAACDDAVPTGPESPSFAAGRAGPPGLGVMSWNIYVGADLTQLLAVGSLADVPCAVYGVWQDVIATDFPSRAVAIALSLPICCISRTAATLLDCAKASCRVRLSE